jgi:UDP-N-acetyl-D-mannosaminuronate dehydrogenase
MKISYYNQNKKIIKNKRLKVGIIGLGYVGLPLLFLCINKGYDTYGFDIDKNKINLLKKGQSYINYIKSREVINAIKTKKIFLK